MDWTASFPGFEQPEEVTELKEGTELIPGVHYKPDDPDWERKQRNREYRVAARREKRNRKADEKKQRKLNATILRRMTRNPDKYNKNAERNRLRDIEGERRKIYQEAVKQAQRLAAIHDPSGVMFNVSAVVVGEDDRVVSVETVRRREERARAREVAAEGKEGGSIEGAQNSLNHEYGGPQEAMAIDSSLAPLQDGLNQGFLTRIEGPDTEIPSEERPRRQMSKTQQKKQAALAPKPPPPKPIVPEHISIPEGEENWLALWDLSDPELERRVLREKKRKAAERKALRVKQQSGKTERRMARDEKRAVYRDIKLTWKAIKEETSREKTRLKSMEEEESKKIAINVNDMERKVAMDHCMALGFTIENTEETDEIKPRALGMRGVEVDFDKIEIAERRSDIKLKEPSKQSINKRVNLGDAPEDVKAQYIPTGQRNDDGNEEFIKLDIGEGQDHETLSYNHKLRRKLRRAIDNCQIKKEELVRERAIKHYQDKGEEPPSLLKTPMKSINVRGVRILDSGLLETAKQERVRARLELAEFNTQMRVLRKQAKEAAIYAGLKKHAEVRGRIPVTNDSSNKNDEAEKPLQDNAADFLGLLEKAFPAPAPQDIQSSHNQDVSASDGSASNESDDQSDALPSSSDSEVNSDSDSSSADEKSSPKRQKLENGGVTPSDKQSKSTNSARQALIDAESAKTARLKVSDKQQTPNGSRSLREVNGNSNRISRKAGKPTGANAVSNWNVKGLSGDDVRRSKFQRLLGGGKAMPNGDGAGMENGSRPGINGAQMNADLERQYEYGIGMKKGSKRKGLGS